MASPMVKRNKFKSAAESQIRGVTQSSNVITWKPMLQRHVNASGEVEFVSIRVRLLNGDTEHDFNARFEPGCLYAENICEAIAEKEGLSEDESRLFSLWVISKDLGSYYFISISHRLNLIIELQVRPKQDIFELMVNWNQW